MDKGIMKNDKVELQPWDADHYSVLNVCICGKHHNDSVPIKELIGANVCIHYVDEKDDIIKRWQPTTDIDEVRKIFEETFTATNEDTADLYDDIWNFFEPYLKGGE